jgi:UPF0716 protein FxsA
VVPALALAFIVIPLAELAVIVAVGKAIGFLVTFVLLLGFSLLGATLAKREGLAAWRRFRLAMAKGRVPTVEVADGSMVLLAGALLVTPGFITDAAGLLLLLAPVRALLRRRVPALLLRRRATRTRATRTRATRTRATRTRATRSRVVRARVAVGEPAERRTTAEWGTPEVGPPVRGPAPGRTPPPGDPPPVPR